MSDFILTHTKGEFYLTDMFAGVGSTEDLTLIDMSGDVCLASAKHNFRVTISEDAIPEFIKALVVALSEGKAEAVREAWAQGEMGLNY